MKILIVDDSEDNRFLLQMYCKGADYHLMFAENGERAIAAYQAEPCDLIVMDVQMPVMDGLTATRQIRRIENSTGMKRIPILSLTGNCFERDVILALEAGCDAQLSKPISKKSFLAALERWLPSGPAIRIPEGMEKLAPWYLAKCRRDLSSVQDLMERSAFEEVSRLAHNLKGSGSSYGFPDITRLGARMERASSNRNLAELSGHFAEISAYIDAAHIQMKSFEIGLP